MVVGGNLCWRSESSQSTAGSKNGRNAEASDIIQVHDSPCQVIADFSAVGWPRVAHRREPNVNGAVWERSLNQELVTKQRSRNK